MFENKESLFVSKDQPALEHVVFVGSAFTFPNVLLRLVQTEFAGIGVQRLDNLETVASFAADYVPLLVIVEDRFAAEIEKDLQRIQNFSKGAAVVLAYRDQSVARHLLSLQQSEGKLSGLRFIPLNAPVAGWVSMLRILMSGDFVVPGELVSPQIKTTAPANSKPAASPPAAEAILTEREGEVLERVAQGHRNKAIACDLGLSEHTIKLHIHHIINKIGVQNRTAAANWFLAQRRPDGMQRPSA